MKTRKYAICFKFGRISGGVLVFPPSDVVHKKPHHKGCGMEFGVFFWVLQKPHHMDRIIKEKNNIREIQLLERMDIFFDH